MRCAHITTSTEQGSYPYPWKPMKKQNTNSGEEKNKRKTAIEYIKEEHPELTYEEIQDYDRALDDYLNICLEMYWSRVKDGTFPWPHEDITVGDNVDSTL